MIKYLIDNWIAILALFISIVTLLKDLIMDYKKRSKEKIENKKAIIVVKIINKELIISNIGKSSAKNMKILIDDKEINQTVFGAFSRNMDFSLLTANNSIGIRYVEVMNMKRNYNIKVKWEDKYSKNNIIEDVINL